MRKSKAHVGRIEEKLQLAKDHQRKLHIVASIVLGFSMLVTLGVIGFSNATVIDIYPTDAKDNANLSVIEGFGISIGESVYTLKGNPTIEVVSRGFIPLRKTLKSSEVGRTVRVELSELPGQLIVDTKPNSDNTRWFIDGQMLLVAKTFNLDLFAGEHVLKIDSPYFQQKEVTVTMVRGKALNLIIDLNEIHGSLNIITSPIGASININDDFVGVSPLSLSKLGGKYKVDVVHRDYQTITDNVEVTNSENTIERDYKLTLKDAFLNISTLPLGGKLILNGREVQASGQLVVKAISMNSLIYLKDGYFPQRRTVSVVPGGEEDVSFSLKPEMGEVGFYSTPNAIVSIDGKSIGQTPLEISLSAVPHHLELKKRNYRSYKKTITPSSRSAQQIRVTLRTELQARLSESPNKYINSVGIELKRFEPRDEFVMGAPRSEKGQRANEFIKYVRLTKPFYVSTHEVSRAQYSRFRKVEGAKNEPVTSISWIEAAQYCNWLSLQEKTPPFYVIRNGQLQGSNIISDGYRLLSEAEWEWLARKAAKSEQTKFPWGNETIIPTKSGNIADEYAKGKISYFIPNYSDGFSGVAPIGSFPPEKTGLFDMFGNVSEWVHDVYSLTPAGGQQVELNPLGNIQGETHTVKGSNWRSGTMTELRSSYREGDKNGRDDVGFRVARYVYGGADVEK